MLETQQVAESAQAFAMTYCQTITLAQNVRRRDRSPVRVSVWPLVAAVMLAAVAVDVARAVTTRDASALSNT